MHHSTYRIIHTTACYTSRGALAGTRNSLMGPPWRIDPTTHRTMSKRSYHGATPRSLKPSIVGYTVSHTNSLTLWTRSRCFSRETEKSCWAQRADGQACVVGMVTNGALFGCVGAGLTDVVEWTYCSGHVGTRRSSLVDRIWDPGTSNAIVSCGAITWNKQGRKCLI